MKRLFTTILTLVAMILTHQATAQEIDSIALKLNALSQKVDELSAQIEKKSRLTMSGYIHAQWQMAQTKGAFTPFNGGYFPENSDNRFSVRRSRIKATYKYDFLKAVVQLDLTEKGFSLRDTYVGIYSRSNVIGMEMGLVSSPFGKEYEYSSSLRETAERSRIYQTIFPGSDVGAKVILRGKKDTPLQYFKFEAGLFGGNGIAVETNSAKDFVSSLNYIRKYDNFDFRLGTSIYAGQVLNETDISYSFDKSTQSFYVNRDAKNSYYERTYWGVDGQFTIHTPAGSTTVRSEYIVGKQPGIYGSSASPHKAVLTEIFNREFVGYILYLVQRIGDSPVTLAARYDYYDPNRYVEASQIGVKGSHTGIGDVAFNSLSVCGSCAISESARVMVNYDFTWNEKCPNLTSTDPRLDFSKDIKDNVLTLRLQVKF